MTTPYYTLSDSNLINRRKFLRYTGSLAAAAVWSSIPQGVVAKNPRLSGYPFKLGVASGDPSPDGMVLWTRLAPEPLVGGGMPVEPVEVSWLLAEDEGLKKVVRKGTRVATPDWGHSVHVELEGLRPDRWYWYQFKVGNDTSPVGRTRTTPAYHTTPDELRFAFVSCQHYESGYYTAYDHLVEESPDLVVHLGDYIYEYAGIDGRVRKHPLMLRLLGWSPGTITKSIITTLTKFRNNRMLVAKLFCSDGRTPTKLITRRCR
jgi:alkaline phosphatase D